MTRPPPRRGVSPRPGESPGDPAAQSTRTGAEHTVASSRYRETAREFARPVSPACRTGERRECGIVTGGGRGIKKEEDRGTWDAGARSIGLNITILRERVPDAYVSSKLRFQFRCFALRKTPFLLRARAMVAVPGESGTHDDRFETLTLVKTGKMRRIPIALVGKALWRRGGLRHFLACEGILAPEDLDLIRFAESSEDVREHVDAFRGGHPPERAEPREETMR